jgi:glycosyltransferase involved in cell wall biosynthesis
MVLTIHDVSFAAHPEWFSWREGTRRRVIARLAARRARRVVTVSNFSKDEIRRHLHVGEDGIDVIYSGVRPFPFPSPARHTDAAIVLFVGSIFNRRHVPELIDGFGRLAQRRPTARLEIVGDNRTHPHLDIDALAAARAGTRIAVRSYVTDDELMSLYANASAFAFLSDYEGFGFTPLEALAAGVPVVVLDTPIAREVYGPAALYVAEPEPPLIEAALERVLFDADERERLMNAAGTILPRYSWKECAHRTLQVLLGAVKS